MIFLFGDNDDLFGINAVGIAESVEIDNIGKRYIETLGDLP